MVENVLHLALRFAANAVFAKLGEAGDIFDLMLRFAANAVFAKL